MHAQIRGQDLEVDECVWHDAADVVGVSLESFGPDMLGSVESEAPDTARQQGGQVFLVQIQDPRRGFQVTPLSGTPAFEPVLVVPVVSLRLKIVLPSLSCWHQTDRMNLQAAGSLYHHVFPWVEVGAIERAEASIQSAVQLLKLVGVVCCVQPFAPRTHHCHLYSRKKSNSQKNVFPLREYFQQHQKKFRLCCGPVWLIHD